MRLTTGLHRGVAEQELSINTRRVLRDGHPRRGDAASGSATSIGSLTPGKRADVVMVRRHDVATAPVIDVANSLALAAGAENVDTVIVDGRFRKRGGRLLDIDTERVVREHRAGDRGAARPLRPSSAPGTRELRGGRARPARRRVLAARRLGGE